MNDLLVFSPLATGVRQTETVEGKVPGELEIFFWRGHEISERGCVRMGGKVAAISRMELPKNVGLLGTLNYYIRFVPAMAEQLVPLSDLL